MSTKFKKVLVMKVLLSPDATPFLSAADLLPLSPLQGPTWTVSAHGKLIQKMERFSNIVEYIQFIQPADMIPAVSLCHGDYSPGESPAVQVKVSLKGFIVSEQARQIYLLFSFLVLCAVGFSLFNYFCSCPKYMARTAMCL